MERPEAGAPPRLVLLEFLVQYDRVNERSMFFPFLLGTAREHGVEAQWWFALSRIRRHEDRQEGRLLHADLEPGQLETLARRLRDFAPTHLVVTEDLSRETEEAIRGATPPGLVILSMPAGKEFHFRREEYLQGPDPVLAQVARTLHPRDNPWYYARPYWFLRFLGIEAPEEATRYLVEHVTPHYDAEPLDQESAAAGSNLVLVSGVSCGGKPSVADNPIFDGVDLKECRVITGCSYCGGSPTPPLHSPRVDRLALIESQLRRILAAPPGRSLRNKNAYMVFDYDMLSEVQRFCRMVLDLEMPPSTFYFAPRLDDVLREREAIEAAIPGMLAAGHVLKTLIMGIETFSPAEMARFNKRLTMDHIEGVIALQQEWQQRFPEGFEFFHGDGGRSAWSFIFFTPWTLPEDIRINLEEGRRLGLDPTGFWMVSTLLLVRTTPITALARAQGGILRDHYEDRGILYVPVTLFEDIHGALPWHFLDPRTACFFRWFVRAFAAWNDGAECWYFRDDPDFPWIRDLVQGARFLPLDLGLVLLDRVERDGVEQDPRALLSGALAEAARRCPLDEDPRPRHRRLREDPRVVLRASQERGATPVADWLDPLVGEETLPREARVVRDVARVLARGLPGDLGSLRIASLRPVEGSEEGALRLGIRVGDRVLQGDLFGGESRTEAFLASRHFRLCLLRETPAGEPGDRRLLGLLLALLDHRWDGLTRSPSFRPPGR
ncbi:MAG TPA: hypothetical protein PLQ97_11030 [Myxococcota bacterium]|nr:hypothetical protein [Myxococcota bacterium]HQK51663.1 hypothetical protein [Myxococcota bacterium]